MFEKEITQSMCVIQEHQEMMLVPKHKHCTIRTRVSLRASPTVSAEFKFPIELNLFSENEFNSTGNFNSTETVGDACRLYKSLQQKIVVYLVSLHEADKSNTPLHKQDNRNL